MNTKSLIREENLEYIAREIGDRYSGIPLSEKLEKIGIPEREIGYPNTKWRMVFDSMVYCNSLDENVAIKLLGKIIELAVHPVNFTTPDSIEKSEKLVADFNKRLAFDKLSINELDGDYRLYKLSSRPNTKTSTDYVIEAINFLKDEYNRVRIAGLKYEYEIGDSVETLMNVFDVDSPHIQDAIDENRAKRNAIEQLHKVGFIKEYEIEERTKDAYYGFDFAICSIDESKLTKKEEPVATDLGVETITDMVIRHEHTHHYPIGSDGFPIKMEITKMPELSIKNSEENILTKNKKKISLPKFHHTDWNKVEIRFIDEQTVYITADKQTATSDYEALGFKNEKNNKPNTAWKFLFTLAKNNGETGQIQSPIPDSVKQNKLKLSDRLKTIFKNDTDPFHEFSDTNTYKVKMKLTPPVELEQDEYGIREHLDELMPSEQ